MNVCVFDTEVYSNTGGQASKATPTGAIAQFAAGGKAVKKKDLGMMAMSYGYVYVAQVAMGSNQMQTIKAFAEAEAYHGPSLVICYSPCINHGMKGGLSVSQTQEKKAVECGYWHLYRFNPMTKKEGKNPFTLDSKPPKIRFEDYAYKEIRYKMLTKSNPAEAHRLLALSQQDVTERWKQYEALAAQKFDAPETK